MLEGTKLEDVCQPQEVFFLEHHWTVSRALEASCLRELLRVALLHAGLAVACFTCLGKAARKAGAGPAWVVLHLTNSAAMLEFAI